jgi:nitrite reductase (NADH) small subunit
MKAMLGRRSGMTYDLGPLSRIPIGEGRTFLVADGAVAVFRARSGRVFASQAWCPHKRGPLADGLIGDGKVICPLHAYRFDLETGQPLGNDCESLRTYPVAIGDSGEILLLIEEAGAEGAA